MMQSSEAFDLAKYVMDEVKSLECYQEDYDSDKAREALQGKHIQDGEYLLRPATKMDRNRGKFLTLSVKKDFAGEKINVWHFPVVITVEENWQKTPTVYYSLTDLDSEKDRRTTMEEMIRYHESRLLTGNNMPGTCRVTQPCKVTKSPSTCRVTRPCKVTKSPSIEDDDDDEMDYKDDDDDGNDDNKDNGVDDYDVVADILPNRPTLPKSQSTGALQKPTPKPRPSVASLRDTKRARPGVGESEYCRCGIPLKVSCLPYGWSVHRSLESESMNMLYFKNSCGQTAWALPPIVDDTCKTRDYLAYGRLNFRCFELYQSQLSYSADSQLYVHYMAHTQNIVDGL